MIYTWLTGISEDHETLDKEGTLTYEEIAACHRNLEAPARGVNGDVPTHSLPPFRFAGSVVLESSSALGDALVGRRKWTDPEVIGERDILLGNDDDAALALVEDIRGRMVRKIIKAFASLIKIEREAFGENSYFLVKGITTWPLS